jgi:2,4-dienoyl-CoA reductase-like NADH-dependent reductase (Old Yellow Enzyme family)
MVVGSITSAEEAEEIIASGKADMVLLWQELFLLTDAA